MLPVFHRAIHRCWQGLGGRKKQRNKESALTREVFITHGLGMGCARISSLTAYVDGASHGNPGPSGIGVVIDGAEGAMRIARSIGRQDNNVAEYVALLEALQYALRRRASALHVFSDSEVVVKQMSGEYRCRSPRLYSLNWICRKLARSLNFSISHVGRENNLAANALATSAARGRHARPAAAPGSAAESPRIR